MYKIEIEQQAIEDLRDAMFWYKTQQQNLGIQVLQEVKKTIQLIVKNPKHFRKVAKEYRQTKVNIFPYVIVYELFNDKIVIFRIFHTSRNPKHKFVKK